MNYGFQNQGSPGLPDMQLPAHPWSLLSVRAWTHGMGAGQVPIYARSKDSLDSIPTLPEIDPSIRGAQRYQLEQSNAALRREWALQAQAAKDVWMTAYRREYYQAWLPVHLAPAAEPRDPRQTKPSVFPDPILILCPTHMVSHLLRIATSMVVLAPGRFSKGDSGKRVEIQAGPCLTLVQSVIQIVAHVLIVEPPSFPLRSALAALPAQVQAEFLQASVATHDYLGGDLHWWVPMISDSLEDSVPAY